MCNRATRNIEHLVNSCRVNIVELICVSCNVITCNGNEVLMHSDKKIFKLSNLAFNPPQFRFNILRAPCNDRNTLFPLNFFTYFSSNLFLTCTKYLCGIGQNSHYC